MSKSVHNLRLCSESDAKGLQSDLKKRVNGRVFLGPLFKWLSR